MKASLFVLCCLFASPVYAQTFPCTVADKVGTYANGDKKVGLRCPTAMPAVKGETLTVARPVVSPTTPPPSTVGQTWKPTTSAALTDALSKAVGGDTILLQDGTRYVGPFTLPVHPGTEWVTIRGTADLPVQRFVVGPTVPKIVSTSNGVPPIQTAPGAHHWRLIGIDITQEGGNTYGIVRCGSADGYTDLAQVPHHFDFDRVYVHVAETMTERRGIQMHCSDMTVQRSIVGCMHEEGADSQAVGGWEGVSRLKILDNDLCAASEPVLFGGTQSSAITPVPEDIEIRGNHVWKPLAWIGKGAWNFKNLLELKNARRVTITDNVFENNWPQAQTGWAILFTARGTKNAPWMLLEDVTFERNIVRNVAAGINILGRDDGVPEVPILGRRFTIRNNLILTKRDVDPANLGDGRLYMLLACPTDTVIDHNTGIEDGTSVLNVDTCIGGVQGFKFTNNVQLHRDYGVIGTGMAPGLPTITGMFTAPVFERNVLADCQGTPYPAGNLCPSLADFWAQFVNAAGGDYHLKATSVWKNAGTDGKDLGASLP